MDAEILAAWIAVALGLYAGLGLLFAFAFLARGVERLDPAARGATWGFRLVVLPGVVALWPWLARRWWSGAGGAPRVESNAHRRAAARREASP